MRLFVASVAPAATKIPSRLFEMTLRSAGVVPPIVLLDVLLTYTPEAITPSALPFALSPRKLPVMVLPDPFTSIPLLKFPWMASPFIVLPPELINSACAQEAQLAPSSSIRMEALSPTDSVFGLAPGWE